MKKTPIRTKYVSPNQDALKSAYEALSNAYKRGKEKSAHSRVAISLGISPRKYRAWRKRGIPGPFEESIILERAARINTVNTPKPTTDTQ